MSTDTIVLIHGLWMTPRSWEHWIDRYTKAGFTVLAPAWPGMEAEVEELRRDPSPIARLDITQVVDHYEQIIFDLPNPPIIMGHSFGGTFVQLLLDRGLGAAGVAIDSSTVKGVLRLPLSTLKSSFPVLRNPANRRRAVPLTPEQFHYAFTNTLSEEESKVVYDRYHVPAAGHILFEGAFANFNPHAATRVHFDNDERAPLLLIAGGDDHVIPAPVNKENVDHYQKSSAITAYAEFPGRSHYTLGQPGWEQVADYALEWALNPTANPAPPSAS
jgi:pimeloyl-ACP methyl ester carboxylesterase